MSRFTIPSRCEFGVKSLDDQHQGLIEIINSLDDFLGDESYSGVPQTLKEFRALLVRHFSDEEALMVDTDFPGTAEHAYHHKDLLHETDRLFSEVQKRGRLIQYDIDECVDKVLRHMLSSDGPFNAHLHKIQYQAMAHQPDTTEIGESVRERS
jgi:hemerythrin-like metal-binding protein